MQVHLTKSICVSGMLLMGAAVPPTACAQAAPEVVDTFPKQRLKERAEQARIAAEQQRLEEERRRAEEAARAAAVVTPSYSVSSPKGMEMVLIQPGQGQLGSPASEFKRARFENPMRQTQINYAFEVGKYEITFDDWAKCVSAGGCGGYMPKDGGWGKGKRPVINISFDDAQKYLKWLNAETGLNYRLLSEAEWEYVARAGQNTPFGHGGAGISAKLANFDGKAPYATSEQGPYLRKTQPVGQYGANAFGVHDIYGNVYEWVQDCWNPNHNGASGTGAPRTDGDCDYRVMKGGSWVTHGYQMRAAARVRYVTDYRYDDYGFRIARTLN